MQIAFLLLSAGTAVAPHQHLLGTHLNSDSTSQAQSRVLTVAVKNVDLVNSSGDRGQPTSDNSKDTSRYLRKDNW